MNYELLIRKAEVFVSKYMQKHDNSKLLFHNLRHTQNTVTTAGVIAKDYSLKEEDLFIVRAAAWFLNIGYYKDLLHPEESGAKMAQEFFKSSGVENGAIDAISECILATMATSPPGTLLAQIICDANTFYFGLKIFQAITN